MSDFKAKVHKIRFPLGLRPRHTGEVYSVPQLYLRGDLLRGRRRKRGGKRRVRGKEGRKGPAPKYSGPEPPL